MLSEGQMPTRGHLGEVTVVADADSALRLSRTMALARWRSPAGWGLLATIPLILMARRIANIFDAATRSDSWVLDLVGVYFGLLVFTIVIAALVTVVQMIRRGRRVEAYAYAGASMSIRYQQDSLELRLATGTSVAPFLQIKDLIAIGDGVYFRSQGTAAVALPRELFPPQALALMNRELGQFLPLTPAAFGRASKRQRAYTIASAVTAVLVVVAVGTTAAIVWQRDDHLVPTLRASVPVGYAAGDVLVYSNTAYVVIAGELSGADFQSSLKVVDTSTMTITSTIPLGLNANGIVRDPGTGNLYIAGYRSDGSSWVTVVDTTTNSVQTTIPFAASHAWNIAIDSDTGRVYVVGYRPELNEAVLVVVDTKSKTVVAEVSIDRDSAPLVVDSATHAVYVASETNGRVQVIDGATLKVTTNLTVGDSVNGMAADPDAHAIYVVVDEKEGVTGPRKLNVIDTSTNTIRKTVSLAEIAEKVAVDPVMGSLYVLEEKDRVTQVRELDTKTHDVTTTVALGSGVITGIAVDPKTHNIYALDIRTLYKIAR